MSPSTAQRVLRNSGMIFGGKVLDKLLGFFAFYLLIWHLGGERYGQYSFVLVYLGVIGVICDLGLGQILIRDVAAKPEKAGEILGAGVLVSLGLSMVACLLGLTVHRFVYPDLSPHLRLLLALASFSLLTHFMSHFEVAFRVRLRMDIPVMMNLLRSVVFFLGVFAIRAWDWGLTGVVFWWLLLALGTRVAIMVTGWRFQSPKFRWNPRLMKNLFVASLPLGVAAVSMIAYYRLDTLMLKGMKDDLAVGQYNSAVKLAEAFNIIPSAVMVSIYPLLSRFWRENREKFDRILELTFRHLLLLILPVCIVVTFFSQQILSFLPPRFGPAAGSLVFLCWAEVFMFANMVLFSALNAAGKQRFNMLITVFMLICNASLNWLLIPGMSHLGASLATVVTEGCGFILECVAVFIWASRGFVNRKSILGGVAGLVLAIGCHCVIRNNALTANEAIVVAVAGMLLYVVLVVVLRAVSFKEIRGLILSGTGETR